MMIDRNDYRDRYYGALSFKKRLYGTYVEKLKALDAWVLNMNNGECLESHPGMIRARADFLSAESAYHKQIRRVRFLKNAIKRQLFAEWSTEQRKDRDKAIGASLSDMESNVSRWLSRYAAKPE